jgi:hypothetical protein
MTNLSNWYQPSTLGDWMGVCGPATPIAPDFKEEVDFAAELGVKFIRLNGEQEWLSRPMFWDQWRTALRYVVSMGLEPVQLLNGALDGYAMPDSGMPTDQGLAVMQTKAYDGLEAIHDAGCNIIETQNEADGPGVKIHPDIPRFVKEHRLLYESWHSIGARHGERVLCITGGMSGYGLKLPDGTQLYPDVFEARVLSERGALALDGMGAHPYAFSFDPWSSLNMNQPWNAVQTMRKAIEMVRAEKPGTRMWITEVGWPTDVLSERQARDRANTDMQHFVDWQNQGFGGPIFIYEAAKDGTVGHDNSHKFGLRRSDGTWKPTANIIQAYAQFQAPIGRKP